MGKAKEHSEDLKKRSIQIHKSGNFLAAIYMHLDMSGTMSHICLGVFANEQGLRDNQDQSKFRSRA
jgi:hypothetical protein